jgi:hypothetical protein
VKLTDIQLRLLAPLRNTTTVERPLNLTRGTAGKVVAKLRAEGFMRHSNDLPPCPAVPSTVNANRAGEHRLSPVAPLR